MPSHKLVAAFLTIVCVIAASQQMCIAASPGDNRFQAAAEYNASHQGVSMVVLEGGQVVFQDYPNGGGQNAPHALASGTKSFTGLIAAAAVQDGLLALDEKVADTLPEWRQDAQKSKITIRHLLSLTSGLQTVPVGAPPPYGQAMALPVVHEPGTVFEYSPAPFQVFGEVMKRKLAAHGEKGDALTYLNQRLLAPLGIRYAFWRRNADGDPVLPSGSAFTALEWAKVGEFVRLGGKLNGKALVDERTFAELFKGTRANPGYGISWWLIGQKEVIMPGRQRTNFNDGKFPTDTVMAAGAGNQRLYVIGSRQLTVVRQTESPLGGGRRRGRGGAGRVPFDSDTAGQGGGRLWSDGEFLRLVCGP